MTFSKPTRAQINQSLQSQAPNRDVLPAWATHEPVTRSGYRAPNKHPEHDIQSAIVKYLHMQYPTMLVSASYNGAFLGGNRAVAMIRAKQAGLLVGLPDLCLICANGKVIWFEVKSDKGVLSDAQKHVHGKLGGLGHSIYVVRSVEDAKAALKMEAI